MRDLKLDDKYNLDCDVALLSGTQALVRLLLEQRRRDRAANLNTAGFVSGYRGSPLAGLDFELERASKQLRSADIAFQPGLNEELAATSVWGSQQAGQIREPKTDGVFALWYGKGPGVDRSGDAFKHGNTYAAAQHGGVLLAYGDDHAGKSSTVCHQSEYALAAHSIPSLFPATVQEVLEFGLLGWAMSRFSGLWVGLKCINETAESTATVDTRRAVGEVHLPTGYETPASGVNAHGLFAPQADEAAILRYKLPMAMAFAQANRIDRLVVGTDRAVLGILTSGKGFTDTMEALRLLGIDAARADQLGLAVYKVGLVWPLERIGLQRFASGKMELLCVEEKKPLIEDQTKALLYELPVRPWVVGKCDQEGKPMLPSDISLTAGGIARIVARRLQFLGRGDAPLDQRLRELEQRFSAQAEHSAALAPRTPYFCSGCPHNRSTKLPDDSVGFSGIGCHGMVMWMDRDTLPPCQMGGEGANWIGIAPFTDTPHIFQNLGDGTYAHSGSLAIRAAIAAKVNITYKILYNDAVAMTGGQPVEGQPTPLDIARQVRAEGVEHCVLISDEPSVWEASANAIGVKVYHRRDMMFVQAEMKGVRGVSAIIYVQTCAAEKRRRRKRGRLDDPSVRPFINAAVCEGCGDCSTKSNCVSILPLETELGRKREIDQSSCNKDYSCIEGFCPSFVSVYGGAVRKSAPAAATDVGDLPEPAIRSMDQGVDILIAGIGGTGVMTLGLVLAMAANLEGKGAVTYNMTGLAQKGGAVFSHIRFADTPSELLGARLGEGGANLLLVADPAAAIAAEVVATIDSKRTIAIVNKHLAPLAQFQAQPDLPMSVDRYLEALGTKIEAKNLYAVDATSIARIALGDSIGSNMFLIGYALQKGRLPVSLTALERAIELNGVSVDFNKQALRLGRIAAVRPGAYEELISPKSPVAKTGIDQLVESRAGLLTQYQDRALAEKYREFIGQVRDRESGIIPGSTELSRAIAENYAKLLSYKDEYEVARLYSDGDFRRALTSAFEGDYRIGVHLAPPILSRKDKISGEPVKLEFGPWIFPFFRLLAKLKWLRGTPFDIFGYSAERRAERAMADAYPEIVDRLLGGLSADKLDMAVAIASLPQTIRGYGHVKEKAMIQAANRQKALFDQYGSPPESGGSLPEFGLRAHRIGVRA